MKIRSSNKPIGKIVAWLSVIVIAIVLSIFYFWKDASDRHRFEVNNKEVEMIYEGSIKAMGAIPSEDLDSRYHPTLIGDGFWQSIACIDQTCPQISKQWVVPIAIAEQKEILTSIVDKYGYTLTTSTNTCNEPDVTFCDVMAKKKGYHLSLSTNVLPAEVLQKLDSAKTWRSLSVSVRLRPQELGL